MVQNLSVLVLTCLLAVGAAWQAANMRGGAVKVVGLQRISHNQLIQAIQPWLGYSVLTFPATKMAEALYQAFPIRDLLIEMNWPDQLTVHIVEREPEMWMVTKHGAWGLDAEGYRLGPINVLEDPIQVTVMGCPYHSDNRRTDCQKKVAELYRKLEYSSLDMARLSTIAMQESGPVLWLNGPLRVRLGNNERIAEKMDLLNRSLKWIQSRGHNVQRIDLQDIRHPLVQLDTPVG